MAKTYANWPSLLQKLLLAMEEKAKIASILSLNFIYFCRPFLLFLPRQYVIGIFFHIYLADRITKCSFNCMVKAYLKDKKDQIFYAFLIVLVLDNNSCRDFSQCDQIRPHLYFGWVQKLSQTGPL